MNVLSRRDFLNGLGRSALGLAAAGLLAARAAWPAGPPPKRKPNVVFILADDLGWRDTSLYGSTFYETPSIDRLAKRGMMFTSAYAANPLCSPTRASIMTGLWPARIGITAPACHMPEEKLQETVQARAGPDQKVLVCASATRLKQEYYTLAEALHDAGYRTGHFGKWHLGPDPYDPLHQGFDSDKPHWSGPGPAGGYFAPWKFKDYPQGEPGENIEDRMAEEAVRFVRENKDRPFFLNYWHFSVHSPWIVGDKPQGKPELIEKYRAKADPANPQHNPVYAAMVETLDAAVGRIVDAIDRSGLADDTIIIFFSDNGGVHFAEVLGAPVTSNAPLRGGKATIYEGGTREDCIVVWPGQVKAGSRSDAVIQSIDFYPTILDMLGLAPKEGRTFDGISIAPALRGAAIEREAIFCFFPHATPATGQVPAVYVRKGDWKLIRLFHDGPNFAHRYELYNLKDDLGEANNLADRMPDRVRELDALIERFLKESGAVLPRPNPAYKPGGKTLKERNFGGPAAPAPTPEQAMWVSPEAMMNDG
jgi:arylsulfatase A-like enzyme